MFTSLPVPTVIGISPTSGPAQGATKVTITGTGFTGATGVKFGNTSATSFTVSSASAITAVAPPWTGGPDGGRVEVSVTTPVGTSAVSPGDGYRYLPPYPLEILTDQPSVYWRFGEPAGGKTASDLSGHGLAGTYSAVSLGRPGALRGDPSTAMGLGQGDLNPPSSPTEVAYRASKGLPSGVAPRTVELWYRTALAAPGGSLVSYGGDGTHAPFDIQLEGGGTEIAVSGGTAVVRVKLPAPLAARSAVIPAGSGNTFRYWTGVWHLIDVTYDGNQVVLYEDGKAVGLPITDAGVMTVLGYPLAVGGTAGDYQEFALYPAALSAERILAHFNAGRTPVSFPGVSAPRVTRVSPDEGANDLDQKVAIFGANFKTGAQVLFGGHPALSTTFVSTSKLEAVLPFFSLSQAGTANVTVIGNGTSNAMPFFVWTHAIGQLMFDNKYPDPPQVLPGLYGCTASVLDSQSGGVLATAGHCTGNAMTSDGHAWAFAPGYTGGRCLSTGETSATTALPTTLGCGFAPEGVWTANKANSRAGCVSTSCTSKGVDWGFIAPNHASNWEHDRPSSERRAVSGRVRTRVERSALRHEHAVWPGGRGRRKLRVRDGR